MTEHPPMQAAGSAMVWQALQMGGVKLLYMIRLLVLAILLVPEDFGLLAIALSATGLLVNLTNLGLIPAAVQAHDMDDARYDAVWTFDVTRSVLIALLTIFLAPVLANIFAEPRAAPLIQVLAFRPLLESLMSIRVAALNRSLTFRPLALLKVIEAFFNMLVSIALAKLMGVWAMVFGMIAGSAAMVIVSYVLAPYRPRINYDWHGVRPLINFGSWLLITSAVAVLGSFGIRTIISRQVGAEGLGLYFLALSLALIPNEVATEVVGTVAFPLFARLKTSIDAAARAFQTILAGTMALLFPVCALIIVLAPILVQDILGEKWKGTIPLIQILGLVAMISLLSDVTLPLVKGFGQPYRITQLELFQSCSLILTMWVFTSLYGVTGTALARLPVSIIVMMMCLHFIHMILRGPLKELGKPLFAIFLETIAGAGSAYLVIQFLQGIPGLIAAGFLAVITSGSILWFVDHYYSLGLIQNIRNAFPQAAFLFKNSNTNLP